MERLLREGTLDIGPCPPHPRRVLLRHSPTGRGSLRRPAPARPGGQRGGSGSGGASLHDYLARLLARRGPQPAHGSPSVTDLHCGAARSAGLGASLWSRPQPSRRLRRTGLPATALPDRARPRRRAAQSRFGRDGHARPSHPAELVRHTPTLSASSPLSVNFPRRTNTERPRAPKPNSRALSAQSCPRLVGPVAMRLVVGGSWSTVERTRMG
jgi:hypothetical protein